MYKPYDTPYRFLPKSDTRAGPMRLAVDRIPVNGTYDKRLARACRKHCHTDDNELNVEVGDPVFVDISQPSDSELFLFSNVNLAYLSTTEGSKKEKIDAIQELLSRSEILSKLRFIGFSETDIKFSEMNRMDIHICANTGGSLSVLCGEREGIRTNDNICIDLPENYYGIEKEETPQTVVSRLVVRRYDKVLDEVTELQNKVAKAAAPLKAEDLKILKKHYKSHYQLRLMGKCLQGGEFGHRIRILLRPTHIKRRSEEQFKEAFPEIVAAAEEDGGGGVGGGDDGGVGGGGDDGGVGGGDDGGGGA